MKSQQADQVPQSKPQEGTTNTSKEHIKQRIVEAWMNSKPQAGELVRLVTARNQLLTAVEEGRLTREEASEIWDVLRKPRQPK